MNGLCECGCGQATRITPANDRSKGWVKGMPLRFLKGHSGACGSGPDGSSAKGGRYLGIDGYVRVSMRDGSRQYEHHAVAEHALGRKLKHFGPGDGWTEVMHHIDGDKANNAPSNLLICTHRYHTALHHRLERSPDWPQFKPIVRRLRERKSQ